MIYVYILGGSLLTQLLHSSSATVVRTSSIVYVRTVFSRETLREWSSYVCIRKLYYMPIILFEWLWHRCKFSDPLKTCYVMLKSILNTWRDSAVDALYVSFWYHKMKMYFKFQPFSAGVRWNSDISWTVMLIYMSKRVENWTMAVQLLKVWQPRVI